MTKPDAARLLEDLLADDEIWHSRASPLADPTLRATLAEKAVAAYLATGDAMARDDFRADETLSQTIWLVRDIADRCAVLSQDWTERELKRWVDIPSRENVRDSIRNIEGVDRTQPDPLRKQPGPLWKLRTTRRRVAAEFAAVDRNYTRMAELRRTKGLEWFEEHPKFKRASALFIATARNNQQWALVMEDERAFVTAQSMLLMAQGAFVATHAPAPEATSFFPTESFLRELLQRTGSDLWLSTHGKQVPAWLTPSTAPLTSSASPRG